MNKKIILGLGVSLLVASSLLAFNPQSSKQNSNATRGNFKSGMHHKMMKKGMHGQKGAFVKMVLNLDLNDKQRTQIKEIIMASMKDMPNPSDAFTDANFDKEKFIKLAKQKRDAKVERKAKMMAKVYNVLNSSQKKDLKTMINMKNLMKKRMIQNRLTQSSMKPQRAL